MIIIVAMAINEATYYAAERYFVASTTGDIGHKALLVCPMSLHRRGDEFVNTRSSKAVLQKCRPQRLAVCAMHGHFGISARARLATKTRQDIQVKSKCGSITVDRFAFHADMSAIIERSKPQFRHLVLIRHV